MQLQFGDSLGSYEILSPLGAGGMGEVYRARDPRLERDVAVKVLPEDFASSQERLARFEREAKSLAALNHPNIATVHGFEQDGDVHYLVMELVEGEDLAERLRGGPIPVGEAIPLFRQIADGLEAAPEKGIIHRDLKPANIKVGDDGLVKILDFGLAKGVPTDPAHESAPSESPTITFAATQQGQVLGTAAYMAPEQAKGQQVDRRADIWAFGACLYEALTGRRAFEADDASDTLAAVLRAEVDWGELPADTPRAIRRLLERCLQRDAKDRLRHIADGAFEFCEVSSEEVHAVGEPASVISRRVTVLIVAALLAGSVGGYFAPTCGSQGGENRQTVARSVLAGPSEPRVRTSHFWADIAITPDGQHVVYPVLEDGVGGLHVRPVDSLESVLLARPALETVATSRFLLSPFASPDSAWIGFYDFTDQWLKKVSITGGPPVKLVEGWHSLGSSWGADGFIYFSLNDSVGIRRVPAGGGDVEILTMPDHDSGEVGHAHPDVLPGGRSLLFAIAKEGRFDIAVLDLVARTWRTVLRDGADPRWVPTGHLAYGKDGSLWAAPFDLETLEVTGDAVPVVQDLVTKSQQGVADFAFTPEGRLVYVAGPPEGGRRLQVGLGRSTGPGGAYDGTPAALPGPAAVAGRLTPRFP